MNEIPRGKKDIRVGRSKPGRYDKSQWGGFRRLACAVIIRAVFDLSNEQERASARCFLLDDCNPWAEASEIADIHERLAAIVRESDLLLERDET